MTDTTQNNKRIAKNTLLLYFRMLLTMAVSIYTSRVVLSTLGVEDYGIYNVVGGVVAMFSVISGSLSAAISRFITYELGKGDKKVLENIFSSAVTIQLALGLIIFILAEAVGVWFLNAKMNIPESRMYAANWVFQLSMVTFIINLISVPYNAAIIAHERMSAFAYISILEVSAKLLIVYLLLISPIDKLIFYAILMTLVALIIRFVYGYYCKRHFEECTYHFIFDSSLLKRMFGFAGWNFIGASSAILRDQGGNVLMNLFCGPTANAARGIANQVNAAVQGFVTNFMTALNPQITKSYASGEKEYMKTLIYQGARLSFYMLFFLSAPIIINTHYVLEIWLKTVPEHTVLFIRLILIFTMSESISSPIVTGMLATGNIKKYQIAVGSLQMMNLPISYILLYNGFGPQVVFITAIFISQCCLIARLWIAHYALELQILQYIYRVYINILLVSSTSLIIPFIIVNFIQESFFCFLLSSVVSVICTFLSIYFIGCNKNERVFINEKVFKFYHKIIKK
ncbi:MAG: hypothetical protein BHV77_19800 [Bacteroides sp. 43_108]|nr:MAG: hypothetical protein BHV77_19800 [Bacteroides sp. 43_108]